ncbi:MAG: hypothetical protein BAJALOKI2v1_320022 [Promethearchaeota archaeon]|nr:MAG: hypothetical protein BAJALOKI2v1_320022 [Candidatus Lokiarchaeota archaeon]
MDIGIVLNVNLFNTFGFIALNDKYKKQNNSNGMKHRYKF